MVRNMVKNVYVKFKYDRLCIDKALGNIRKWDNNIEQEQRSWWWPFPFQK